MKMVMVRSPGNLYEIKESGSSSEKELCSVLSGHSRKQLERSKIVGLALRKKSRSVLDPPKAF